jgi:predicted O-linked N-acetylglucosamine transferase (SPINDLY family)
MNTLIEVMNVWQKTSQQFAESFIKAGDNIKSEFEKVEVVKQFTEPTEVFQKFLENMKNSSADQQKVMDNNIKFQKALIAYNQAMVDMMEAVNENAKLINKK